MYPCSKSSKMKHGAYVDCFSVQYNHTDTVIYRRMFFCTRKENTILYVLYSTVSKNTCSRATSKEDNREWYRT